MTTAKRRTLRFTTFATLILGLAACDSIGGFSASGDEDPLLAPGVDLKAEARTEGATSVEIGHRLIAAGEYELAIRSFNRAALQLGTLNAEILSGMGTANLEMGRLGQAEELLRRAAKEPDAEPVDLNNLGVLLMEQGKIPEAVQYFRRAFALSNGENIAIRDNLRLALEKSEKSVTTSAQESSDYKLVRRGSSDFLIRATP